jgi:hypothetical protein
LAPVERLLLELQGPLGSLGIMETQLHLAQIYLLSLVVMEELLAPLWGLQHLV